MRNLGAALAALAIAACGGVTEQEPASTAPAALEGSWQIEDIDNGGVIDDAMVRIDFGADGRIAGRAGCNTFTGSLAYANGVASVGPLAATKKLCAPALMDLEQKFLNRLQGELTVTTTEDGALVLSDADGRLLMRRMEDEAAKAAAAFEAERAAAEAAAPADITAAGEIVWDAATPLPENAFLRVKLIDVSRMDIAATTLAEARLEIGDGPPVAFALTADGPIDPRARLSVSAQISDGAALHYTSDTHNPVSPEDGASGLSVRLVPVDVGGTGYGGAPVTPVPTAYACGGETFRVAFEEGRAYVTDADGTLVMLDRLDAGADAQAPRTYTNGRMTFVHEMAGDDGPRVLFARGRMMPAPCETEEG